MKLSTRIIIILVLLVVLVALVWIGATGLMRVIQQTASQAMDPLSQSNSSLSTQVAELRNPTPTIIPDPITLIREVRTLARLETIQYTVEKVITAEIGQNELGFLFGDKLLFVAHGQVIAGVDMEKIGPQDMWVEGKTLYFRLPPAEVFVATLDNEKSYVYNRETGLLTRGDTTLETKARQAAEAEILKAAIEDGILKLAQQNAETYLARLMRRTGFGEVIFVPANNPEITTGAPTTAPQPAAPPVSTPVPVTQQP